jgi:hypothetical protein
VRYPLVGGRTAQLEVQSKTKPFLEALVSSKRLGGKLCRLVKVGGSDVFNFSGAGLGESALWRRDRDYRIIKTRYTFLRKKKSNQVRGGERTFVCI